MTKLTLKIPTTQAMTQLGECLNKHLTLPLVIYFSGEIGAGKTTLIRAVLRARGIEGPIKSPSYALIEPYEQNSCTAVHMDLYRVGSADDVHMLGIRDYLTAQAVLFIEWPEKGYGEIPPPDLHIQIDSHPQGRMLTLFADNSQGDMLIQRLSVCISNEDLPIKIM